MNRIVIEIGGKLARVHRTDWSFAYGLAAGVALAGAFDGGGVASVLGCLVAVVGMVALHITERRIP